MTVVPTPLPGVLIIQPKVFGDDRGFFFESYNHRQFCDAVGSEVNFVQDNHSRSAKHVLRGLHYQIEQAQGKLVRVARGKVYDAVVDLRKSSATFGQTYGVELSEEKKECLWVPAGFGHGFLVLSDVAEFLYKTTDYYSPVHERCIMWNDPALAISWPLDGAEPVLSAKDTKGQLFQNADYYP